MKSLIELIKRDMPPYGEILGDATKYLKVGDKIYCDSMNDYYIINQIDHSMNRLNAQPSFQTTPMNSQIISNFRTCKWGPQ